MGGTDRGREKEKYKIINKLKVKTRSKDDEHDELEHIKRGINISA